MQLSRRFWLIVHDVLMHPVMGVIKAVSWSTKPWIATWMHDATIPPMPKVDRDWSPQR